MIPPSLSKIYHPQKHCLRRVTYLLPSLQIPQEDNEKFSPGDETNESAGIAVGLDVGLDGEPAVRGVEERPGHTARLLQSSERAHGLSHHIPRAVEIEVQAVAGRGHYHGVLRAKVTIEMLKVRQAMLESI